MAGQSCIILEAPSANGRVENKIEEVQQRKAATLVWLPEAWTVAGGDVLFKSWHFKKSLLSLAFSTCVCVSFV